MTASTICQVSPTRWQARTRLYRDGRLELEGSPATCSWPPTRPGSTLPPASWLHGRHRLGRAAALFHFQAQGLAV